MKWIDGWMDGRKIFFFCFKENHKVSEWMETKKKNLNKLKTYHTDDDVYIR